MRHDSEAQVNLATMLLRGECISALHQEKQEQREQQLQSDYDKDVTVMMQKTSSEIEKEDAEEEMSKEE